MKLQVKKWLAEMAQHNGAVLLELRRHEWWAFNYWQMMRLEEYHLDTRRFFNCLKLQELISDLEMEEYSI